MRKVTYSIKIMPSEATVIIPSELTSTLLLRSLFQVATLIMCGKKTGIMWGSLVPYL